MSAAGARLDAAERFVWLAGRLIDRHRFAYLFRGGDAEPVRSALLAYRNPDGGFGNGLEPDLRGPSSQPVPLEHALNILDEIGGFSDPVVPQACDWLLSVTRPDGGVPFVLPSALSEPRAPWWQTSNEQPGSVNPTAALAGILHKHEVDHPWLAPATAFCWDRIEALEESGGYDLHAVLSFLEHVPDRSRASAALERVRRLLEGIVVTDPDAGRDQEVLRPLFFAPRPESPGCELFPRSVIERNLEALVAAQQEDGGWPIDWQVWTPAAGLEWRAYVTVEALTVLRAYEGWRNTSSSSARAAEAQTLSGTDGSS